MGRSATQAERENRQAKVKQLVASGLSSEGIATELNTTKTTINNDRRVLGIVCSDHPSIANLQLELRTEARIRRQAEVSVLGRNYPPNWIARKLGVHVSTIRKDLQMLGIRRG